MSSPGDAVKVYLGETPRCRSSAMLVACHEHRRGTGSCFMQIRRGTTAGAADKCKQVSLGVFK
jgi:hypothetical protein